MTTAVATLPTQDEAVEVRTFDFGDYLVSIGEDGLKRQQELAAAYDRAVRALVGPNDIQVAEEIDKRTGKKREFKKKSAWCKLARHFGISTELIRVETNEVAGGHLHGRVIVRGTAPWGQTVEVVGGCSTEEKRFKWDRSRARHDCESTAETRAQNRAISRLIAAGEVSAEEMEGTAPQRQARTGPPSAAKPKPLPERTEVELLELREWAEKQGKADLVEKINSELERRRDASLEDLPPELAP